MKTGYAGEGVRADVMVGLHARRSAAAVRAFRARHPERPLIVALTGTDLYLDLRRSGAARRSLSLADRLIVLQPMALRALPPAARRRARVVYQSVERGRRTARPAGGSFAGGSFDVCVLSHLRWVKDPLRAAIAARALPGDSRVRVLHAGRALAPAMAARARAEGRRNPRYRWLGERSRARARSLLERSRLLVLSSRAEGGANVLGEAAVAGVPVLASRVDGSAGILGHDYPGFFPVGDTAALRELLVRAEADARFYERLRARVSRLAPLFSPARERQAWRKLLAEL